MVAHSALSVSRTAPRLRDSEPGKCHVVSLPVGDVVAYTRRAPYKEEANGAPNEDSLAVIEIDAENFLLVVADGVGGSPGGEAASGVVIDKLMSRFAEPPGETSIAAITITALEDAHEVIRAKGNGSASTVAVAHVSLDSFRPAHAGDSVIMACGNRGKLKFETISHSPVGYALEAGVLSEDEAFTHEDRHVVSNIIGGQDIHITLGSNIKLAKRDTLLLASDGVTDNLRLTETIETIRKGPLPKCGEALANLVAERMESEDGKPDDVTFLLFRRAQV